VWGGEEPLPQKTATYKNSIAYNEETRYFLSWVVVAVKSLKTLYKIIIINIGVSR